MTFCHANCIVDGQRRQNQCYTEANAKLRDSAAALRLRLQNSDQQALETRAERDSARGMVDRLQRECHGILPAKLYRRCMRG